MHVKSTRSLPLFDELEHQPRRTHLQRRGDFRHVRIAEQEVNASELVRVGQRLIARVHDRPVLLNPFEEIVNDVVRALGNLKVQHGLITKRAHS
jgi:hypothetical protein